MRLWSLNYSGVNSGKLQIVFCHSVPGIHAVDLFATVPAEIVFRSDVNVVQEDFPKHKRALLLLPSHQMCNVPLVFISWQISLRALK